MALAECRVILNRSFREIKPHGTESFPCAGYFSFYLAGDIVPWHWHDEMEIIYINDGSLKLKVPSLSLVMRKGDMAAVNSGVLHYVSVEESVRLSSLVFKTELVSGGENTSAAKKYILPLAQCRGFSAILFADGQPPVPAGRAGSPAECFAKAFSALEHGDFAFEITVRENLSALCLSLYKMFEPEIGGEGPPSTMNDVRIKKMLGYIHENFPYDITLSDIASCVHVSERECIRCFQKTIHTSPIQYLLKYRIMCAADMLAGKPLESISWIAGECGFDSASNFSQTFKRFYNLTPREYRALYAARKSRIPPQDE